MDWAPIVLPTKIGRHFIGRLAHPHHATQGPVRRQTVPGAERHAVVDTAHILFTPCRLRLDLQRGHGHIGLSVSGH